MDRIQSWEDKITIKASKAESYKESVGECPEATLTWLEVFVGIASLVKNELSIENVHYFYNRMLFGYYRVFIVPDSVFYELIGSLVESGMMEWFDVNRLRLSPSGMTCLIRNWLIDRSVYSNTRLSGDRLARVIIDQGGHSMKNAFDWDTTVEFKGYSHWTGYEKTEIPTIMTYREALIALGTLMLTISDISLIHYEFNYTLYGNSPVFCVRDFDFNSMLQTFIAQSMIELKGTKTKTAVLTTKGREFLLENQTVGISYFEAKRQEAKKIIDSVQLSEIVIDDND